MFNLRKMLEGAVAQVNTMDGGKTFKSVNQPTEDPEITNRPPTARNKALYAAQEQMTRDNQITNRMVAQGKLPQSQAEIYPQRPFQQGEIARFHMQPAQGAEDDALVQGPQGYHPMNADIANFRMQSLQQDPVEQIRRRLGLM